MDVIEGRPAALLNHTVYVHTMSKTLSLAQTYTHNRCVVCVCVCVYVCVCVLFETRVPQSGIQF
jgi:hypothetical protein